MSGEGHGRRPVDWQQAWHDGLYGDDGFYRRPEGPAGHFRTACHVDADGLAGLLLTLGAESGCRRIVDVGAGRGELAAALVAAGCRDVGAIDVVERPPHLPGPVDWVRADPWPPGPAVAVSELLADAPGPVLVTAFELLDVVACPVVELDADGVWRRVLVDRATGREHLGDVVDGADAAWLRRWWPIPAEAEEAEGARAEVGRPRDAVWASLATALARHPHGGVLLAVDYAHTCATRPLEGSLSGFRAGRAVPARPDGGCDVTAHVAMDAAAEAAVAAAPGVRTRVLRQDEALTRWWPGPRPPDAELTDPGALGGFTWLVQEVPGRPQS